MELVVNNKAGQARTAVKPVEPPVTAQMALKTAMKSLPVEVVVAWKDSHGDVFTCRGGLDRPEARDLAALAAQILGYE